MPSGLALAMAALAATPIVSATAFSYYRSVFCDAQSPDFLIEGYASPISMSSDKMCHQTPTGTMGMKVEGGIEENCVILAYEGYACTNLIGSVPASGKCVAATKAKIGSWQALCAVSASPADVEASTSYAPGDLKRRGKARLPAEARSMNSTMTSTITVSSFVSEISSTISASSDAGVSINSSLTKSISSAPEITPAPSMTTSVCGSAGGAVNGTSGNGTHGNGTYVSPKVTTTATYTGTKDGNGSVVLAHGGAGVVQESMGMVLGGLGLVIGFLFAL